jgi:hypothetical protein
MALSFFSGGGSASSAKYFDIRLVGDMQLAEMDISDFQIL